MARGKHKAKKKKKRNVEGIIYNFALWKIKTIADVKHHKQPPQDVLKIFRDVP